MILGGEFGGVWAAMSAAAERDRRNAENLRIELVTKDRSLTIGPTSLRGSQG
jgi:NADH dehydrogenase